ncbi:MAG: hypothetical protein V3U80_08490, partial [Flavobacteriaceae bacterium]
MKNILILGVFLTLINCTMISQDKVKRNEFIELHKHKGSENYEVVELFENKFEMVAPFLIDKEKKDLVIYGFQEEKLRKQNTLKTKRISNLGKITKVLDDTHRKLKDGTMRDSEYYVNWIINGDTTKHKYLDPFTNKEIDDPYGDSFKANQKDHEKQFEKFKELYAKAQYIYVYSSFYYFKIDKKWYLMRFYKMSKALGLDIEQLYPPKEDQDIRMVALQDLSPKYFIAPNERDTQLIREMEYESTEYEE